MNGKSFAMMKLHFIEILFEHLIEVGGIFVLLSLLDTYIISSGSTFVLVMMIMRYLFGLLLSGLFV
jgi:hypothetical protein